MIKELPEDRVEIENVQLLHGRLNGVIRHVTGALGANQKAVQFTLKVLVQIVLVLVKVGVAICAIISAKVDCCSRNGHNLRFNVELPGCLENRRDEYVGRLVR